MRFKRHSSTFFAVENVKCCRGRVGAEQNHVGAAFFDSFVRQNYRLADFQKLTSACITRCIMVQGPASLLLLDFGC